MSVDVKKQGEKYRVINKATGQVATGKSGDPLDGGGYKDKNQAVRTVQAVNGTLDSHTR